MKRVKYSPKFKTLIGIDNDLVFKPELSGDEGRTVNVKSVIYLLPQIDSAIPEPTKTFFTSLDPHLTMFSWLKDLSKKNKEYRLLFTRLAFQKTRGIYQSLLPGSELSPLTACLEQRILVDADLHNGSFCPQILVSENLLSNVLEKLQLIEKTLLKNPSASNQILFEEVFPLLGKYYRRLRNEFGDPKEALDALWGENGVNYSSILSLLSLEEFESLSHKKVVSIENLIPEIFLNEYKRKLASERTPPLDNFIQRHSQRKRKNLFNFNLALEELRFLIQEGFLDSQSPRDIVDFCYGISKMPEADDYLRKEITLLLSNLPIAELQWLFTLEKYFLRAENDILQGLKSIPITGAFMKRRILNLTESEKRFLFDEHGNIKKNNSLTGRSRVTCFPEKDPEFYLKQYPEFPGYEFASTMFMRILGIKYLPYHDLIIVNNSYPVLISQNVKGKTVHKIWNNSLAFHNLDPVHTGLLIIAAMLLNPEDSKEDNFILSPDGRYLIPIDSDHCFLPSTFQKVGNFWNRGAIPALQTKTLLFCLQEMKESIPPEVKQQILDVNFDKELESWMTELDKLETRFNNLLSQEQRKQFLEQGTVMRIPFYKQFIHNIHWKAHKIQDILKNANKPTPFDLLKALEPFTARCYEESFQPGYDLQSRFKAATDKLYPKTAIDGSRFSAINTRTMIEIINISKEDLQNDAMFQTMGPMNVLELLKELIREHGERVRGEQEILFELDDSNQEKKMVRLFGKPPVETALEDFFANPKEGLVLKGSKLIVSSKLTAFFALTPDQGKTIRFLSLENSPLLTHRTIRTLAKGCPNLEYLNVSGCVKLTDFSTSKEEWPLLARLEAKDCFKLERFVSYSPMKILRMGIASKIEIAIDKSPLDIFTMSTKVNEFHLTLKKEEIFEIKVQDQSVSTDTFVLELIRQNIQYFSDFAITFGTDVISSIYDIAIFITSVDLSNCSLQFENFRIMAKMLNLKNLKKLNIALNGRISIKSLEYLIQGNWSKLNYLDLSRNEFEEGGIRTLCQGNWPFLETLNLEETKVTPVGIEAIVKRSNWPRLKHLNLRGNEIQDKGLQSLSQGKWSLLEILNLQKTKITAVGIEAMRSQAKWFQLKNLNLSENDIYGHGLEELSLGNWTLLETLHLENTKIVKKKLLTFLLNRSWDKLNCVVLSTDERSFSNCLLQRNCDQLEYLDLSSGQIMQNEIEIIVHQCQWPKLKSLNLSSNDIKDEGLVTLSQGNWPELEILNLEQTKVTAIGIEAIVKRSNWSKLKHLNVSHNPDINDEALQALVQGNWPLLKTLDFDLTNVTKIGLLKFVLKTNWPNLQDLICRLDRDGVVPNFLHTNWSLLEELDLSSSEITQKEIGVLITKGKWPKLKVLNLSNNEIFDKGVSELSLAEWPSLEELNLNNGRLTTKGIEILVKKMKLFNLKKLNVSENAVFDEGLEVIASGNWPLFEHFIYYNTKVTPEGTITMLKNMKWPNLNQLEHSMNESFYNLNKELPQIVLVVVPVHYEDRDRLMIVLDTTWLNSKEIDLFIDHRWEQDAIILPREKLHHLEHIKLSTKFKSIPYILWPSNLKGLNFPFLLFPYKKELEKFLLKGLPSLESLGISQTDISTQGLKNLVNKSDFSKLKKLDISDNEIQNEGFEVLTSLNSPLLEDLNLGGTNFTVEGIKTLINQSNWPNLKKLDISKNKIQNEGLIIVTSGKWHWLEDLNLSFIRITAEGIESFINKSNWPNLRKLNVYGNKIQNEGPKILASGKWQMLEYLNLGLTGITFEGIGILISEECSSLKQLDISENPIEDEGLKLLSSAKWPLLGELNLAKTKITKKGIESMVSISKWNNLKRLDDSSRRMISDKKLENLVLEKWPLLNK